MTSLAGYNTLGVESEPNQLLEANNTDELIAIVRDSCEQGDRPILLGGGSNVVLRRRIPGTVVRVLNQHFSILADQREALIVDVGAGYPWDALVRMTLRAGWFGLENLVSIPGTAGAAPMQNIGAYGVEIADRLHSVQCLSMQTGEITELPAEACEFSYRGSLFKSTASWVVLSIRLKLSRRDQPVATYPDVAAALGDGPVNANRIAAVVAQIRQSKLPDPSNIGNAGSFFKNPVVAAEAAERLTGKIVGLRQFPSELKDFVKLSAAQLIDQAGWKGKTLYGVGVWDKQPLVLVNRGARFGSDFLRMAETIRTDIEDRYGVSLEIEPVVLGQD